MSRYSGIKLSLVIIIIAIAAAFSVNPIADQANLGLDLRGGAHVLLQAIPEDGSEITNDDMVQLTSVMRKRVDEFGVSEPKIQRQGDDRLIVEIAGITDPDKAIEKLGTTAKLEFVDPAGTVVVSGSDLKDAQARIDQAGAAEITLVFTPEGAKKFGAATARLVGQPLSIVLDGQVLQSPVVEEPIMNGEARISGSFTFEEAADNAALLRGGSLPVSVQVLEKRTVGPSLGSDSLQRSLMAGIVGFVIVVLFMMVYYRLPGILAAVSLILYVMLNLWVLVLMHVTLTLPGIAGFLLSIGMAVDANVIIYERIKEELRAGKSLRAGIDSGFKRAFVAIFDSNVTTLIAAAVLFYFGAGSIQGFAVTLSIGILASMFTAITFTRLILVWTADLNLFKNTKLYGA